MAWSCSGSTNAELVDNMVRKGILGDTTKGSTEAEQIARAMKKVDRANYVRDKRDAYQDSPQTIGHGATISAPHMHAYAVSDLLPYLRSGGRALDVGSGSGYLSAVLWHLLNDNLESNNAQSKALVTGIEHIPELTEWSQTNLKRDGLGDAVDGKRIEMVDGDGRLGYEANAPYTAIHVGAAAPELPQALVDQLAPGGRMFIPIGTHSQNIYHIDKDEQGNVTRTEVMAVGYVPLTDRAAQR